MKVKELLYDSEWLTKLHKVYFWGSLNEKVLIYADGTIQTMAPNTWFQEEPDDLVAVLTCPGWNNVDTSPLEEGVGIYDEESGTWKWDPEFIQAHPEYARDNPQPSWEDIINASIEEGDWEDVYEWFREEIIEQMSRRSYIDYSKVH